MPTVAQASTSDIRAAVRSRASSTSAWAGGAPPAGIALDAWILAHHHDVDLPVEDRASAHGPTRVLSWGAEWPMADDWFTFLVGLGQGRDGRTQFRAITLYRNGRGGQSVGQRIHTSTLSDALRHAADFTASYRNHRRAARRGDRDLLTERHVRDDFAAALAAT